MKNLTFVMLFLTGCPTPPAPVPVTPAVDASVDGGNPDRALPSCPATMKLPTNANVCVAKFTQDHHVCVDCGPPGGCWEILDQVYCVKSSCSDPYCNVQDSTKKPPSKK